MLCVRVKVQTLKNTPPKQQSRDAQECCSPENARVQQQEDEANKGDYLALQRCGTDLGNPEAPGAELWLCLD